MQTKTRVASARILAVVLIVAMFAVVSLERASAIRTLTVTTGRGNYERGEPIRVSGMIPRFVEHSTVEIRILNPIRIEVARKDVFPATDGRYSVTFSNVINMLGVYTVEARYRGHFASTTFIGVDRDIEGRERSSIVASTSRGIFDHGDKVTVYGSVHPVRLEQPVIIKVFNPLGDTFRFANVKMDANGRFSYGFRLEGDLAAIGAYTIDVGYFDAKKTLLIDVRERTDIIDGRIIEIPTRISPVVTSGRISVLSANLVNPNGAGISHLLVGQDALIQSEIRNNEDNSQNYAYIVQIKDVNDVVVSLSWVEGSINPDQILNVAQSWIPESAGIYRGEIFAWSSISDPVPLASTVPELDISVAA